MSVFVLSGVAMLGCNSAGNPERNATPAESSRNDQSAQSSRTDQSRQPMTVTGCLQKQDQLMDKYVLTAQNAPRADAPVATGGQTAVEREQMRQAMGSYELKGMHSDLEKLVGSEVRITGTLDEQSDLTGAAGSSSTAPGGSRTPQPGTQDDRTNRELQTSDLTAVNVERVEQVSPQCAEAKR